MKTNHRYKLINLLNQPAQFNQQKVLISKRLHKSLNLI